MDQEQGVSIPEAAKLLGIKSDRRMRVLVQLGQLELVEPAGIKFKRGEPRKFVTRASLDAELARRKNGQDHAPAIRGAISAMEQRYPTMLLRPRTENTTQPDAKSTLEEILSSIALSLGVLPDQIEQALIHVQDRDHRWMRPSECARLLGLPAPGPIWKLVRAGDLPTLKVNGRKLVRYGEVKELLSCPSLRAVSAM